MFSADISETLREILNSVAFIYLILVFTKRFGFKISSYPKPPNSILYFILLVIASLILSSVFSINKLVGFINTFRQIIFFIICFIMFSFIDSERDITRYIKALIASGVFVAVSTIFSFLGSNKEMFLLKTQGLVHEGGIFSNVSAVGGLFAVSIPLNFITILSYDSTELNKKYLNIVIFFIQLIGLFLTNSREAILAVFISLIIIMFVLKRKAFIKLFFSGILFFSTLLLSIPLFSDLFESYFRLNRVFENTRYYLWNITYNIIKDNPVWGTGPGQFKTQMYNHLNVLLGSWTEKQILWVYQSSGLGESHNFILFRTAELGFGGLISALLLPILFILYCIRVKNKYRKNKKYLYIIVGIFSLGVGLFVRSFFEATGLLSHGWITRDLPFWLSFSVIIYLDQNRENDNESIDTC